MTYLPLLSRIIYNLKAITNEFKIKWIDNIEIKTESVILTSLAKFSHESTVND